MIPFIVSWTEFTATVQGRVVKLVPCEDCGTEYVYVLKREGVGKGTSVYGVGSDRAETNASSGAQDALEQYLTNDFDAVPCPVCGHYQRFMFLKLLETRSVWSPAIRVATLFAGLLSFVFTAYYAINYWQKPNEQLLRRLGGGIIGLAVSGTLGVVIGAIERRGVRTFDPNQIQTKKDRIALGQSRATTRAEFEATSGRRYDPEQTSPTILDQLQRRRDL